MERGFVGSAKGQAKGRRVRSLALGLCKPRGDRSLREVAVIEGRSGCDDRLR